jgi:hypothetical protein
LKKETFKILKIELFVKKIILLALSGIKTIIVIIVSGMEFLNKPIFF